MSGYSKWWLSLVALLPLIRIAPVYCQHTEDYRLTFLLVDWSRANGYKYYREYIIGRERESILYGFNYPQCVCTAVYLVGYSPSLFYYILLILHLFQIHHQTFLISLWWITRSTLLASSPGPFPAFQCCTLIHSQLFNVAR